MTRAQHFKTGKAEQRIALLAPVGFEVGAAVRTRRGAELSIGERAAPQA